MLNDPEIDKLIIYALAGICAVLAIAVIYLGVKKNQYIPDSYEEPVRKKAREPEPVTTAAQAPTVMKPIQADFEKEDQIAATRVVPVSTKKADVKAVTVTVRVNGRSVDHTINTLPCLIGRETGRCDLVIPETAVSRRHARMISEKGELYLEDVSEHNGTYINGTKLTSLGKGILKEGDEISLGRAAITVNKIIR